MPGNYTRSYVPNDGDTLTAAGYNGELDLIRTNWTPTGLDDASATVSAMQTTVDPGESGSESLATDLAGEIHRMRHMIKEITGKTYWYQSPSASMDALCPVGAILPFYDYNGTVTFNTSMFAYCDGSTVADAGSPINGQVLPDLSGRYLVGFGTDGGTDIDTATWNVTAVGNAGHTINVAHTHTDAGHTHSLPSHSHSAGTLQFKVAEWTTTTVNFYDSAGSSVTVLQESASGSGGSGTGVAVSAGSSATGYTKDGSGSTASTGGTSGSGTASLGSSLSSTQSIQPRSIRVRYIIRYK